MNPLSILLTLQGPRGEFGDTAVTGEGDAAESARKSDRATAVWQKFLAFKNSLVDLTNADIWACTMEVCGSTLAEKSQLKLHVHMYLRKSNAKVRWRTAAALTFEGSYPNRSLHGQGRSIRATASMAACYCLQAPKVGVVHQASNTKPFIDYSVSGQWVFQLLQGRKMTFANGRSELVETGCCLVRRLADLKKWEDEVRAADRQQAIQERQAWLLAQMSPFVRLPVVERWLEKYSQGDQMRKPCLASGKRSTRGSSSGPSAPWS